jgi:hypothetical protein
MSRDEKPRATEKKPKKSKKPKSDKKNKVGRQPDRYPLPRGSTLEKRYPGICEAWRAWALIRDMKPEKTSKDRIKKLNNSMSKLFETIREIHAALETIAKPQLKKTVELFWEMSNTLDTEDTEHENRKKNLERAAIDLEKHPIGKLPVSESFDPERDMELALSCLDALGNALKEWKAPGFFRYQFITAKFCVDMDNPNSRPAHVLVAHIAEAAIAEERRKNGQNATAARVYNLGFDYINSVFGNFLYTEELRAAFDRKLKKNIERHLKKARKLSRISRH